jgi:hypothetical protein
MKTHSSTARARDQRAHFGTIKRQWGYNHTNLTGLESKWRTQPDYAGV